MSVEDKLGIVGISLGALEEADDLHGQVGVKAGVELINAEDQAVG